MFSKFESISLRKTILQYRPTTQGLTACNNKLQENTGAVVFSPRLSEAMLI